MWFLIKGTFWFSMVLVALSYFGTQPETDETAGPKFALGDAITVATDAYQYISAICSEKPDVCEKGAETLTALGHRAREGAYVAYQILDSQFADDGKAETAAPDMPMKPATVKPAIAAAETKPAAEPATISEIITGTVTPEPRPKNGNGPKPYTPPKL
ncbi:DUF5330 domain-containing protein [Rhizobium sp. S95]|uniref:DUF5330 domain-containing protein n=1 Tax=Ciceribacter sichuanensis TaxID=2949647 RepID=A0AAJ1BT16_9HYPH|nr:MULTISPECIES: DUF5330 domain-containing protein [unclassified Ciceribacter]MCM2395181.1 DUF5330 domain-containing protein [Ciceribacter sp. S95]MCO5955603.1 DUF5330 domain-containing protein [Ciceribacter sp. S101]